MNEDEQIKVIEFFKKLGFENITLDWNKKTNGFEGKLFIDLKAEKMIKPNNKLKLNTK
jgi:hypothetical protein